MQILENYDLKKLNTFAISAKAKFFIEIGKEGELHELFNSSIFRDNKKLFLGGGSNVLFTKDFDGIVILNKLKGIEISKEDSKNIVIKCLGGEIWHDLVTFVVDRGYWGIENLSLIPGTVGAAPMQNIGAYGAQLEDVLENVEAYDIDNGEKRIFKKDECELGYRDSIFKNKLKDKYFITAITLKLSKIGKPNVSYKILQEHLVQNKTEVKNSKASPVAGLRPRDISDAVTAIRKSKLPDPNIIANAGSFFKNPFVNQEKLDLLLKFYPTMPYFTEGEVVKIPAGWLIEQCGPASPRSAGQARTSWKGYKLGNVGVHDRHSLVLVNHGGGKGEEIQSLADQIIASVFLKFNLKLETEVNLI